MSAPFTVVDQCGDRALSVLSIIRWPRRHGQSNATHLGRVRGPTITAPFRGSLCGMSSAESTTPTIRQRKTGSHSHQRIFLTSAMFVPGTVELCPLQAYSWTGDNNGPLAAAQYSSKFPVRGNVTRFRSAAAQAHSQSIVPAARSQPSRQQEL